MSTWQGWEQQLLNAIGAPITSENVSFLDSWANAEGGSASYNPMNTTQPEPGATNYNSVGVKEYGSAAQGIAATATTLQNGYYPDILAGLKSGNPFSMITDAFKKELDIWGTGSGFLASNPTSGSGTPAPSNASGSPNPFFDPLGYLKWMAGGGSANTPATPQLQYWYILVIGIVILFIGLAIILSDHPEVVETAAKAAASGA